MLWNVAVLFAGRVTEDIGSVTFALFLQVVFRNQERWATWLVGGVAVSLMVGVGGSFWVGDWEGIDPLGNPVVVVGVGGGRFSLRLDGDLDIVLGGNDSPPFSF